MLVFREKSADPWFRRNVKGNRRIFQRGKLPNVDRAGRKPACFRGKAKRKDRAECVRASNDIRERQNELQRFPCFDERKRYQRYSIC